MPMKGIPAAILATVLAAPPKGGAGADTVPDAHVEGKRHAPMMFTTDLVLKFDPVYREISQRFLKNPQEFELAFAKAWFKLTHRDMGPRARYLGAEMPKEVLIWQDPVPDVDYQLVDAKDIAELKTKILDSGLSTAELVRAAGASASTFRGSDMRGGANGARIRLAPQKDWPVNDPAELARVLKTLEGIQKSFNDSTSGGKKISLADLIVLGGAAAIEQAAKEAGYAVEVPFTPGCTDATQEQTDVASFAVLEPTADGFRNCFGNGNRLSPAEMLVDRADLLGLTVPEMTALVGDMRTLGANAGGVQHGVLTDRPGTLNNDFFVNLLDMATKWSKAKDADAIYEGRDRATGELKWTATPVDLIFGSNAELRAVAEVYASKDGDEEFVRDFRRCMDQGDDGRPLRPEAVVGKSCSGRGWRQPGSSCCKVSRRRFTNRSAAASANFCFSPFSDQIRRRRRPPLWHRVSVEGHGLIREPADRHRNGLRYHCAIVARPPLYCQARGYDPVATVG